MKSLELKKSGDELLKLTELLQDIERETRLYRKNLSEIFCLDEIKEKYKDLLFLAEFQDYIKQDTQPDAIIKSLEKRPLLNKDANKILKSFFLSMGNGDISEELIKTEDCKEKLRDLFIISKRNYEKKGNLYKKLSFLFGTALAILFI